MADEYGLQGLAGHEIVTDLLAQLKKRLEGDCSFRSVDSYSRGYSAKISYHIECYGLDKVEVDGEFDAGHEQDDPDAEVIDEALEIKQEEDLGEVRDRIRQANGGQQEPDENESPEPAGARTKRKYTRKLQLASPGVIGGAEDFKE